MNSTGKMNPAGAGFDSHLNQGEKMEVVTPNEDLMTDYRLCSEPCQSFFVTLVIGIYRPRNIIGIKVLGTFLCLFLGIKQQKSCQMEEPYESTTA